MIGGTGSGCGKTTVTCALLQAFVNRKMNVCAYKCGPDYIDPMFYSRITGNESRNLDSFFCDDDTLNRLLDRESDISVIEGVMGFYDGLCSKGSSHEVSLKTNTPVIIVIGAKGMGESLGAVMKGFLTYRKPNNIIGFIFDRLPEGMISAAEELCRSMNVKYFGRIAEDKEAYIPSRSLGLVTPDEDRDIHEKMKRLGENAERNLLTDDIISAAQCSAPRYEKSIIPKFKTNVRIALSRDEAFCFYYPENIRLLESMGAHIIPFSPLYDKRLPENIGGIILCGGYPELYIKRLSDNTEMLCSIKNALKTDMPCIAECGGFMYLHDGIRDTDGALYSGVGAISAEAYKTDKLRRFGYVRLTAEKDNMLCRKGEGFAAHEFHRWESTDCGGTFTAVKPFKDISYKCVHGGENLYAGFPHLYLCGYPGIAVNFLKACEKYGRE